MLFSTAKESFAVLGLIPGASENEIKKAYKILAFKYHTDHKDSGNPEMFIKVTEAKNSALLYASQNPQSSFGGSKNYKQQDNFKNKKVDAWDIKFASFDTFCRPDSKAKDILNIRITITVTAEDVADNKVKILKYKRYNKCSCSSHGETDYSCPVCSGSGVQQFIFGAKHTERKCDACNGKGVIKRRCPKCKGASLIQEDSAVEIPLSGIVDGSVFTFVGGGHNGSYYGNYEFGDLGVRIKIV